MSSRYDVIRGFFRAHLKIFTGLALAALIVMLGAGSLLFYRYHAGPDYAFAALRAALNEGNKAALARMVDFQALSKDLVQGVLAVYGQAATSETRRMEMCDEAQRLALKALAVKQDAKRETVPPRKLFEAVPFVPEDVIAQFAAGMKLEKVSGGTRICSQFVHNELQTNFPVCLSMERRLGGWLVTHVLDAQDLVKLYKGAMDAILAEDNARLAEKNEKIQSKMRAHFASPQCLAAANLMGDQQDAMLVIKVTAKNADTTTLHNVNLLCDVRAGDGTLVYSRQLNVVQRVYGGGAFSNIWTVTLDAGSEEAAKLLQAGPLSCTVEPKVMSVGAGEILYPRQD
ncbi:MAG: DUF2939 domain-containing protein [Deltaproteobacteria bacterium]|nr:DUF2939 domain-containing protein [Deltaproteobacteria bacterium]